MSRLSAKTSGNSTAAWVAIPRRASRGGVEGPAGSDAAPDSPLADDGDAHEPAAFSESSAGTALFGDGDFSNDDGGAAPHVA